MMKRLIAFLFLISLIGSVHSATISTIAYLSADNVSVANLESNRVTLTDALNSLDGTNLTPGSVSPDALTDSANPEVRWNEAFNDWVFTGLTIPTTSGTLTSTTTLGTAYINGKRVTKDATAKLYTASKHTYVDLSQNGTYTYSEVAILAAEPGITADSIRIARVSSDATQISEVRDDRITAINLATSEDQFREDLLVTAISPDAITISPGSLRHGTTFIAKTASSDLNIGSAGDWATGVSGRGTNTMGFVVVKSNGTIKLTTTAPTLADTSSNTTGRKRYSSISSELWRVIGWFYMNGTGSGNIDHSWSNFKDKGIPNQVFRVGTNDLTTTSTTYLTLENLSVDFYTSGRPVKITSSAPTSNITLGSTVNTAVAINDAEVVESQTKTGQNVQNLASVISFVDTLAQGSHTISLMWKVSANTGSQNGSSAGERMFIVEEN